MPYLPVENTFAMRRDDDYSVLENYVLPSLPWYKKLQEDRYDFSIHIQPLQAFQSSTLTFKFYIQFKDKDEMLKFKLAWGNPSV